MVTVQVFVEKYVFKREVSPVYEMLQNEFVMHLINTL